MTLYNTESVKFVADKASETHKVIKSLNKDLLKAKSRSEKDDIESKIDQAKQKWWEDVKHLMVKHD